MKLELLRHEEEGAMPRSFIDGTEVTDALFRLEPITPSWWNGRGGRVEATLAFDEIVYLDEAPTPKPARLTTVTCAHPESHSKKFLGWLRDHGLNPDQITTVHNIDDKYLIVEGMAVDARGRKYLNEDFSAAVEFPKFAVRIKSPMPWVRTGTR